MTLVHIALALVAINFIVYFHELGHYLLARAVGISVAVFSVGFGPPLYKRRAGDTVFQIGCIPLGGYVKMLGITGNEKIDEELLDSAEPNNGSARRKHFEDRRGWFSASPRWEREIVLIAGPLANFILFFVLTVITANNPIPTPPKEVVGFVPSISQLDKLRKEDRYLLAGLVTRVDDTPLPSYDEIVKQGDTIPKWRSLSITRSPLLPGGTKSLNKPFAASSSELSEGKRFVGTGKDRFEYHLEVFTVPQEDSRFLQSEADFAMAHDTSSGAWLNKPKEVRDKAGSIISILIEGSVAARRSIHTLLEWMAYISLVLGISNLLPIPPLDGGRIVIELFRKAKPTKAPKPSTGEDKSSKGSVAMLLLFIPGVLWLLYSMGQSMWYDVYRLLVELGIK